MRYWMYAMIVLMVAFASALLRAESAESNSGEPVLVMKEDLFNMDDADTRGLQEVPGAETITIYRAEDDTAKFSNHPQLTWFKGHYYATWQATPRDEDSDDSVAVFSRSADGRNWSAPQVLAPALTGGIYHASGGWWTDGEILVCLMLRMDTAMPGRTKQTIMRTSPDGEQWTPLEVLLPDSIASASPQTLSDGRILFETHGAVDFKGDGNMDTVGTRIWYSDNKTILNGMKEARVGLHPVRREWVSPDGKETRNLTYGTEPSIFERPDGKLTMVGRQSGGRGNRTHRVWAFLSADRGETWSAPVITNMYDSDSMQCAGNLPDGTAFMINCPNVELRRVPLAISLSSDGIHFDRAYLVRGAPPERRYEGKSKTLGYSYPGAFMHDGYLWVSYATNKEDIEVTRIPVSALMP